MGEDTQHTDDLRNVQEGDDVTIETTEGEVYDLTCVTYQNNGADPRTGEIRETRLWVFEGPGIELGASITDGLKGAADQPDFPIHMALTNPHDKEEYGYVEDVKIHGKATS